MTTRANHAKHALLIGINQYPNLPAYRQLKGCLNDGALMEQTLTEAFDFPPATITRLCNEQATRDGIVTAMEQLITTAGKEDIVVVYYSGHGSQRTSTDATEPDGLDETLVPYDSGRDATQNRDITDKEIAHWLRRLTEKTSNVTLIFDCCHSGSISRDAFGARERWVEADRRSPAHFAAPSTPQILTSLPRTTGPSGWLTVSERYVLIAGCRDDESSYELAIPGSAGLIHGALTYYLNQVLLTAVPGTTYRDLFEQIQFHVTTILPRQHPQLEGHLDREVLGVQNIPPLRFVRVGTCHAETITLHAGAAHGMTIGSRWAIYPPATKTVTPATPQLGLVEITEVAAVTATAQVYDGQTSMDITLSNQMLTPGCRAVEAAHHYGSMRLLVEIHAPPGYAAEVAHLTRVIAASRSLHLVDTATSADVRIYLLPPRNQVAPGDPLPQVPQVDRPRWAVVGNDGCLRLPTCPVGTAEEVRSLVTQLETFAQYTHALALRNPDPASRLRDQVTFILKRKRADGSWGAATPDTSRGMVVFNAGEEIALEITNHYQESVYVSVLDFGITGSVSLLHPPSKASECLRAGRTITIGGQPEDMLELELPPHFPTFWDPGQPTPTEGHETLKLFATTHPTDFRLLIQPGFRSPRHIPGADTPLVQLFQQARSGIGFREVYRTQIPPHEEWTTVERSFVIRKTLSDA